jgi:hypothetical protein
MAQFDLFAGTDVVQRPARPSEEEIRIRVEGILNALRQATQLPWTDEELRFQRTVVPQMTNWLPSEEADALRTEFHSHLERLSNQE